MNNILHDSNGKIVICQCGGHFIFEQRVLLTEPPQYPYRCNKCGKVKIQRDNKTIYEM
jgi:predicted SprT family Zn-dependent metalloprotease